MDICITGVSRGLGNTLCRVLLARGHRVWGIARSESALRALESELQNDRFRASVVDITDATALERWRAQMETEKFGCDVLVLNASIQLDDMGETFNAKNAKDVIDVNLTGTLATIGALFPAIQKSHGRIVAVTSTIALRPSVRSASYAASKAGLRMAMRSLRVTYRKSSMSFGDLCLGPVATDMWEGKRSFLVPSAKTTAMAVAPFIESRRKNLYYPFLTTMLLRLSLWLPDSVFAAVSHRVLK